MGSIEANQQSAPELLARLAAAASTGRLEDLEIEYWVGGGLPPPHHRSEQLRFLVCDGKPIIELNVATHDPARPALVTAQYRAALGGDELRRVARLLSEVRVFERWSAEVANAGVADALRTELVLLSGDRTKELVRAYSGAAPAGLEEVLGEMRGISERARQAGTRRDLDGAGRELSPPGDEGLAGGAGVAGPAAGAQASLVAEALQRLRTAALGSAGSYAVLVQIGEGDGAQALARALEAELRKDGRFALSTIERQDGEPVPEVGRPGGHVHVVSYRVEPFPAITVRVMETENMLRVGALDPGSDPLGPSSGDWLWLLERPRSLSE